MSSPGVRGIGHNAFALVVSSCATGVLGLAYWALMGRWFPADDVGAAAAVISTATVLSAFGNLGLGSYLERFLALVPGSQRRLVIRVMTAGTGCGALLAVIFLIVGPRDAVLGSGWAMVGFPLVVATFAWFALLDHVSIALRSAQWAAAKNITHAVLKLLAALGASTLLWGRVGIVWTWVAAAVLTGLLTWWALRRRLSDAGPGDSASAEWPTRAERRRFVLGNFGIYVATAVVPLTLPLIVVARVGTAQNAYFALVWSMVTAVIVLMAVLTGPYVAAASADPGDALALTGRFVGILFAVGCVAALGFAFVGPWVLRIAGPDYVTNGIGLIRLAAVAMPLATAGLIFTAIARVRRRLLPALFIQGISAATTLTLSTLWIADHGLIAVGWALLIAECLVVVLVTVLLARLALQRRAQRRHTRRRLQPVG